MKRPSAVFCETSALLEICFDRSDEWTRRIINSDPSNNPILYTPTDHNQAGGAANKLPSQSRGIWDSSRTFYFFFAPLNSPPTHTHLNDFLSMVMHAGELFNEQAAMGRRDLSRECHCSPQCFRRPSPGQFISPEASVTSG